MPNVIYSNHKPLDKPHLKSIFLAGPTPRCKDVPSWRPQVLEILKDSKYDDVTLCYPEYSPDYGMSQVEYTNQIEWEHQCLDNCSTILFWVPRCLKTMPAFTTNIEFGMYMERDPLKVVYGRPNEAPNNRYMDYLYTKKLLDIEGVRAFRVRPFTNLALAVKYCVWINNREEYISRARGEGVC
jgi:hypothetical protein